MAGAHMSKLFDDLKRKGGEEDSDNLDLFAYAAKKAQSAPPPASPPPAEPEPEAVETEPSISPSIEPEAVQPAAELQEPLLQHEPAKSSEPLYRGLSPLSGVRPPPHDDDRRAVIIAVVAVCGLLVLAILVVGIARGLSRAKPVTVAASAPATSTIVIPKPAIAKPVQQPNVKPAGIAVTKPVELGGKGMVVTAEGSEKVIVFEAGIFASGAKLSREGTAMLAKVGRQLAPHAKTISVTVVGCTDNVPVSGKKEFKDNTALGLLRADAALRVLQSSSGIPAAAFKTVSHGAEWSPFPNDSASSRARNRTVVLRIAGL
jgi:flagellar motor protein MotB